MKNFYFIIIFLLFYFPLFAQNNYESGYFINNNGNKIECLIKNLGWKETPTKFQYKLSEEDSPKFATIKTVQEFSVKKDFVYKRVTLQMDNFIEPRNKNKLDYNPQPEYVERTIFLKVLISGKASLYLYNGSGYKKFFFSLDNTIPEQLFYKRYLLTYNTIKENNQYKQQLYNNLQCETISSKDVLKVDYYKEDLMKLFKSYNECENVEYTQFDTDLTKNKFNLTVRPGVNFNFLSVNNRLNSAFSVDFGSQKNFRLGLEAEIVFGFNHSNWSLIFEPTYQYFKADKEIPFRSASIESQSVSIDYQSIELPLGVRHYFIVDKSSKVFLNASFVYDIDLPSKIDYELAPREDIELVTTVNFAMGIGYKYGKNLSLELRYYTKRDLFKGYGDYSSKYKNTSLILGYTLF